MAELQATKTEKLLIGLALFTTALATSMVIFQFKRHAEYLYLKSKADEAANKAEAAVKTVSHFDGQIKKYFTNQAPKQKA